MTHRLYPAIYRLDSFGERPPPLRTLLIAYESSGLIESARDWARRIERRNRLVHEYPLDPADRRAALEAAIEQSEAMLADLDRALADVERRRLLETSA